VTSFLPSPHAWHSRYLWTALIYSLINSQFLSLSNLKSPFFLIK
jgi:hypothetical protein